MVESVFGRRKTISSIPSDLESSYNIFSDLTMSISMIFDVLFNGTPDLLDIC